MKKLLLLFLLFSFGASAQQWTLVNNTLTIQVKKNTSTPVQVGKWLSNFAIVGDSVSIIYQRNQDNSHFTYYLDKDSVVSPVMASATALYDTLVKWTVGESSSTFDTTSMSNRIDLKLDSVRRIPGTDTVVEYYNNGTQRFAFIDSVSGATISAAAWALLGNSGTSSTTNFVGTTDNIALAFRVNNKNIMRINTNGSMYLRMNPDTLIYDSTSINSQQFVTPNLAIGDSAIEKANTSTPDSIWRLPWNNTALGYWAGRDLYAGWANVFVGTGAGTYTIGYWDTLAVTKTPYNVGGYENVFLGYGAGHLNRMGYENTFLGTGAGYGGIATKDNVLIGTGSGNKNQANNNTFVGTFTGLDCISSPQNVFVGSNSGENTVSGGGNNVYIGGGAGRDATTAFSNTIVGSLAGLANNGSGQVMLGYQAGLLVSSGAENLIIGEVGGDNITTQSNQVSIGKGYVQGTYSLDTTHTWMWGTDVQNRASNTIRLNGRVALYGTGTAAAKKVWQAVDGSSYGDWGSVIDDDTLSSTATIVLNVDSVSILGGQWERSDSTVTVSGVYVIDADSAGVVEFEMSLPVSSDFTQIWQLAGTAFDIESEVGEIPEGAGIFADIADNRAVVRSYSSHTDLHKHSFHYTYRIK